MYDAKQNQNGAVKKNSEHFGALQMADKNKG